MSGSLRRQRWRQRQKSCSPGAGETLLEWSPRRIIDCIFSIIEVVLWASGFGPIVGRLALRPNYGSFGTCKPWAFGPIVGRLALSIGPRNAYCCGPCGT